MRSEHVVEEDLDERVEDAVEVAHVDADEDCHTPFALT